MKAVILAAAWRKEHPCGSEGRVCRHRQRKLGVVMGDGVHTGINTSINVGVMMEACMSTRPGEVVMR